jgi:hypothetical protein
VSLKPHLSLVGRETPGGLSELSQFPRLLTDRPSTSYEGASRGLGNRCLVHCAAWTRRCRPGLCSVRGFGLPDLAAPSPSMIEPANVVQLFAQNTGLRSPALASAMSFVAIACLTPSSQSPAHRSRQAFRVPTPRTRLRRDLREAPLNINRCVDLSVQYIKGYRNRCIAAAFHNTPKLNPLAPGRR